MTIDNAERFSRLHYTGDPLQSVDLKLARADQCLDDIKALVEVFYRPDIVTLRSEFSRDRTTEFLFVRHRVPLPTMELGILIAEFVHELRTTLDYLAWALASLKGSPPRWTAFPICRHRTEFFAKNKKTGEYVGGLHRVSGMRPNAQAFIEGLQPYDGRSNDLMVLRWVQDLDNLAKHRVIPVVALQPQMVGHALPRGTTASDIALTRRPLEHGGYFGTLHHDTPRDEAQTYVTLKPEVAIPADQPGRASPIDGGPLHVWLDLFWMIQSINRFVLYPARRDYLGHTGGYTETWNPLRRHWRALGVGSS